MSSGTGVLIPIRTQQPRRIRKSPHCIFKLKRIESNQKSILPTTTSTQLHHRSLTNPFHHKLFNTILQQQKQFQSTTPTHHHSIQQHDECHHDTEKHFLFKNPYQEIQVHPQDQQILLSFLKHPTNLSSSKSSPHPNSQSTPDTLSHFISMRFQEMNQSFNQQSHRNGHPAHPRRVSNVHPKLSNIFTQIGCVLSSYKSGPLPKAIKECKKLSPFQEILDLMRPEKWTPHAVYAVTRIFSSTLHSNELEAFYCLVLYQTLRRDIQQHKKLNWHLYRALKASLSKPAAFFKSILFPLCESSTCTLKEAAIIGSAIKKVSIPVLHSSVALLKLSKMPYGTSTSIFIKVLLSKKYALPSKVIEGMIIYFLTFSNESRRLPVLWHQSLLVFVQHYKVRITRKQKKDLNRLVKKHYHRLITPEIKRALI